MNFAWNIMPLGNLITSLVFIIAICGVVFYFLFRVIKRKFPLIIYCASVVLLLIAFLLNAGVGVYLSIGVIIIIVTVALYSNLGDLRRILANPFQVKQAKVNANHKIEKIFDSHEMHKQIENAVISLSKTKTGAIITFERENSLSDIMKNGVEIKAPVSSELLETIFYPGTRLHDGAVVIHGNEIVAASVFFTPTTKAFAGKYGSRHRAAIGISEISDALTVVVSEETGRISFAVNGTLETVDQANFLRVFENLLADKSK